MRAAAGQGSTALRLLRRELLAGRSAFASRSQRGTALTTPRDDWVQVKDPGGLPYWWNKRTDETTAVGEPKPGPEGRRPALVTSPAQSPGRGLLGLVAAGAGIGLVFAVIGRIL